MQTVLLCRVALVIVGPKERLRLFNMHGKMMPMLGICLGMQLTCVEFARHVLGFDDANSSELNPDTETSCYRFDA